MDSCPFQGVFLYSKAQCSHVPIFLCSESTLILPGEKALTENEWTSEILQTMSLGECSVYFSVHSSKMVSAFDSSWFTCMSLSLFFEAVMVEDYSVSLCSLVLTLNQIKSISRSLMKTAVGKKIQIPQTSGKSLLWCNFTTCSLHGSHLQIIHHFV